MRRASVRAGISTPSVCCSPPRSRAVAETARAHANASESSPRAIRVTRCSPLLARCAREREGSIALREEVRMIVSTLVLATLAIDPAAAWSIPSLNGAGVRPAWAGDVDGDGYADLVTASQSDPEHAGIVGVYLGGPSGLPMAPDWEQDLTGDA